MDVKNILYEVAKDEKFRKKVVKNFIKELRKLFEKWQEVWKIKKPREISYERLSKPNERRKAEND